MNQPKFFGTFKYGKFVTNIVVQRHVFLLSDPKQTHNLRDIVIELAQKIGLTLVAKGGGIFNSKGIDFDLYDFTISGQKVGAF